MSPELSQAGLAEYWLTAFPKPSAHQRCRNGLSTALKMKTRNRAGLMLVVSLMLAILALAVPWAEAQVSRAMAATASSYLDRGNTWAKKGEWTQAVADFSLALDFNPTMPLLTTTAVLPAPTRVTLTWHCRILTGLLN
jgi:hypothetical protein